MKDGVVLKT